MTHPNPPPNPRLQQDEDARSAALDPARSFIVEAPAGAGKTELITQRFLRLLTTVSHPEEIVALTFTNKAAGEMRSRILESLHAATAPLPDNAPPHKQATWQLARAALEHAHDWNLLEQPNRLRVTTIDSLCAQLVRLTPLLSRFGQNPGISDAPDEAYREAAATVIAEVENSPLLARMLARLDNDATRLSTLLTTMLARRDQWLHQHAEARAEIDAGYALLIANTLQQASDILGPLQQALLMPPVRFALTGLSDWTTALDDHPDALPRWRMLAELLLTQDGALRKTFNKNHGFSADADGRVMKAQMLEAMAQLPGRSAEVLSAVRDLPDAALSDAEFAAIGDAAELLRLAAAALWLAFQRRGEVDFIEIAQRAVLSLGDADAPTDLALSLDYRIRHLLIDEFQDTSEAQMRLFEALTRGWSPNDGHSLFLVGDPMQSIYRFRKAEVGLFLQVREHGLASGIRPEPLVLFRNNRSCPVVIDWVNRVFPALFGREDILRGEVAYRDCVATRDDTDGAGVFMHPLLHESDCDAATRVIALIRAERAAHPDASIAVLVRYRVHLAPLLAALRRDATDIVFRAVEIAPLASRQPVADLVSLTRALLHRADRVHWLACLRAPWCGLTLADMLAVAGDGANATVWQQIEAALVKDDLSADGHKRLAHFAAALHWALAQDGRMPLRERVEGAWQRLQGPHCLTAPNDLADCMSYLDLLESLQERPDFSAERLDAALAKLFAAQQGDAHSVQLMTIHKSKGLEFDSVILLGLEAGSRSDSDTPPLRWDEVIAASGERRTLVSCMPFPAFESADRDAADRRHRWIRSQENARQAAELKRLLYVAATRARDRLHLVGCATYAADGLKPPTTSSLLALLWPAVQGDFSAQPAPEDGHQEPLTASLPPLLRLRDIPDAETLSQTLSLSRASPLLTAESAAIPSASLDAAIGELVHRGLEIIAFQGLESWDTARVTALASRYAAWLAQRGFAAADCEAGAARVVAALKGCLDSAAGRWVLQDHAEAVCEYALRADGQTHRIDRSFVSEGVRWIVDYKTVAALDNPQVAAERHREQLQRYGALFARLEPDRPQRLAVLFVAQGQLVEL